MQVKTVHFHEAAALSPAGFISHALPALLLLAQLAALSSRATRRRWALLAASEEQGADDIAPLMNSPVWITGASAAHVVISTMLMRGLVPLCAPPARLNGGKFPQQVQR